MTTPRLPILTERLILRTFEKTDLDSFAEYSALPDVQRYLDWKARDKVECQGALEAMCSQVALQRPGDTLTLAIVRRSDDTMMGHIALRWHDATAAQAELRFMLNPAHRGQGFATEAAREVMDLAFGAFRIHRVFARCDARNSRSIKLMQGLGMRLEAHYREHALFQGEWDEELHFAILDREWRRASHIKELHHKVA